MHKYIETMQRELDSCGLMPLFEISVTDGWGAAEFVTTNIMFIRNSIVAQREAVSKREQCSRKTASTRMVCDSAFGLDEHLQELYAAVIDDICQGDLYRLRED